MKRSLDQRRAGSQRGRDDCRDAIGAAALEHVEPKHTRPGPMPIYRLCRVFDAHAGSRPKFCGSNLEGTRVQRP
jgi:hypothetical protein